MFSALARIFFVLTLLVGVIEIVAAQETDSRLGIAQNLAEEVIAFEPGDSRVPSFVGEIKIQRAIANFELEDAKSLLVEVKLRPDIYEIYQNHIFAHSPDDANSQDAQDWLESCVSSFTPPLAIRCSGAIADIALADRNQIEMLAQALRSGEILAEVDEDTEFYLFGKFLAAEWLYLALLYDRNLEEMVTAAHNYVSAAREAGISIERYNIVNNIALLVEAELGPLEALRLIETSVSDTSKLSPQDQEKILYSMSRSSVKAGRMDLAENYLEQLQPVLSHDQLVLAHQYMSAFVYAKNGKSDLANEYISIATEALGNNLDNKLGLYILKAKKELYINGGRLRDALAMDDRIDKVEQDIFESGLSKERAKISQNVLVTNEKFKAQEDQLKYEKQLMQGEQSRQRILMIIAAVLTVLSILFAIYQTRNRKKLNTLNVDLNNKNTELGTANSNLNSAHATLNQTFEELKVAHKQALAGQEAKEKFIGVVGHELRTPLNPIINLAGILEQKAANTQDRALLTAIKNAGKRLHIIVENMLVVSADDDSSRIYIEPINIVDNATTIIREFASEIEGRNTELLAQNKKLKIRFQKSKELNAEQFSNKVIYRAVIRNLFDNAFKFTTNGEIDIKLYERKLGPGFVLSIRDTGIGIDAAKLQELFEPFKQGDMNLNRNHEGAGLGLAVIKKYCDQLGASIDVQSQVNVGTTIRIDFPEPEFERDTGEILKAA